MKKLIEKIKKILASIKKSGSFWFTGETQLEDYE